ncbi:MAG: SDR family oxidoreductase [Frankiaceae bacterium]|nr:SDR family oxidoreductase [Arenimonas sp.]
MSRQHSDLHGKLIVVTGGLGILGHAITQAANNMGAVVALIDRVEPRNADHGATLVVSGIDLADAESAKDAFRQIAEKLGPVHALMNVAGAFDWNTVIDGGVDAWTNMYRANVLSAVGASIAALDHMGSGGAIVNVAAAATTRAAAGMGAYTAAKSGVLRLTESLADELKARGIRVNCVSPTVLDTPRNRADMPDADAGKWLQPADLAQTMLFLASAQSKALTGANLLAGQ